MILFADIHQQPKLADLNCAAIFCSPSITQRNPFANSGSNQQFISAEFAMLILPRLSAAISTQR
jgi:hypothetical protein